MTLMRVNLEKYLERIRAIFLTIVLSSTVLLVAVQANLRHDEAVADIELLSNLLEGWGSYWDARQPLEPIVRDSEIYKALAKQLGPPNNPVSSFDALPIHGIATQITTGVVGADGRTDAVPVQLEVDLESAYVPPELSYWRGSWMGPYEYRSFWRALQEPIFLVSRVQAENSDIVVNVDADHFSLSSVSYDALGDGIRVTGRLRIDDAMEYASATRLDVYSGNLKVFGLSADVRIPIRTTKLISHPSWCSVLEKFSQQGCGNFHAQFPALDAAIEEYPEDVSSSAMSELLLREKENQESAISVAGIEVPRGRVFWVSQLLLWALGIYFVAHLRELKRHVRNLDKPPDIAEVPWIGLFRGRLAAAAVLFGSSALPISTVVWITLVTIPLDTYHAFLAIGVSLTLFGWVGLATVNLRRSWFSPTIQ